MRAGWLTFLNELRLLGSDRVGLFMLILAPVVIIAVAGFSLGNLYGTQPGNGAYVLPVVDQDHGALAHALLAALAQQPTLKVVQASDLDHALSLIHSRERVPLALVIPAGTSQALEAGDSARLTVYFDPVKRLEATAIELRLDQLCRELTQRAQAEGRRRMATQADDLRERLARLATALKQARTTLEDYPRQLVHERALAEATLNSQLQQAIAATQQQMQAAITRAAAASEASLTQEMAPRRVALEAVGRYLIALRASQHQFQGWFAALQQAAGSHRGEIPPPPAFPTPPTDEQLTELAKPLPPLRLAMAPLPPIHPPAIRLPAAPPLPHVHLPDDPSSLLPMAAANFPGILDWHERPFNLAAGSANAFDQYVPGFGITFLLIAMLMGIGMGLIDERDWGTLQRLRISGAPLWSVLAGKLASRIGAGMLQMIILFGVGWWLFGISLGRAPATLLLPTAAIAFAAASFSLVIACIARTHDSVMPIGAVAAMAMSAIGGCWWPLDFEPAWMRNFAQLLPTTWAMEAYNNLMIRHEAAVSALWPSAVAAMIGVVFLAAGMAAASKIYD